VTARLGAGALAIAALGLALVGPRPLGATPMEPSSLSSLAEAGEIEVSLDPARFRAERVAVIRVVNKQDLAVTGLVPACLTIFTSADPADSPLRPAESGPFLVPPRSEIRLIRPFRLVDPTRRAPGQGPYKLDGEATSERGCQD
jgi:hypothetical protein